MGVLHHGAATIADVAARSGVAVSTVSRALSRPERVSAATRAKVEQSARELRYVPSRQARAMRSGSSLAVAVLVPDISNPFFVDIIRGTQGELKAAGFVQLLVDVEESAEAEEAAIHELAKAVDGFVVTGSRIPDARMAALAAHAHIVTVNRRVRGVPSVVIDSSVGMVQVVDHLVSLGHTRIAYADGPLASWSANQRARSLEQAAAERGVELVLLGSYAPVTRAGAAVADAAVRVEATALVAYNDLLAVGALLRLRERGVRVPEELSIVGCDDVYLTQVCSPTLTSVGAPIEQVGRTAVRMLLDRVREPIARRPRMTATVVPHLVVRESTGPAPH